MNDNKQESGGFDSLKMILCSDPHAQYLACNNEIDQTIAKTLASGYYILGPEVEAFEREFADFLGLDECIA